MGIRQFLNIMTSSEQTIISDECITIKSLASIEAAKQESANRDAYIKLNSECPKCHSKNINKHPIHPEHPEHPPHPEHPLHPSGHHHEDPDENECNHCHHKWEKFKFTYVFVDDIIKYWIEELEAFISGHGYGKHTHAMLKDFHAETIWRLKKELENNRKATFDKLDLVNLRDNFKSIYEHRSHR